MIRFIYNLLWPLGLLFFLPGYLMKMVRRGGYREKFGQRLGIFDHELRARLAKQRSTWLHAVSVGEVMIALKLAQQLRALEPDMHCALTTTTTTGFAFANKNASPWIEVMYTPLDFWPIMRRAFNMIQPARIILAEAEVWPNLVRLLDLVCVQEPEDGDRWRRLGVEHSRIRYTGSIKYDLTGFDDRMGVQGSGGFHLDILNRERPVLFGGSTHRGEEEILAKAFLRLRKKLPSLCLFIAPRHVERVPEIRRQLEALSLDVRLASEAASHGEAGPDCVLLDTTGQLHGWYGIATVVFMGKSLTAHGGQNPVEPIAAGKPIIFGLHMENFATLAKALVSKSGAIQVRDADALERAAEKLLHDSEARQHLVQNAREVLNRHRGATSRTAALIAELA